MSCLKYMSIKIKQKGKVDFMNSNLRELTYEEVLKLEVGTKVKYRWNKSLGDGEIITPQKVSDESEELVGKVVGNSDGLAVANIWKDTESTGVFLVNPVLAGDVIKVEHRTVKKIEQIDKDENGSCVVKFEGEDKEYNFYEDALKEMRV